METTFKNVNLGDITSNLMDVMSKRYYSEKTGKNTLIKPEEWLQESEKILTTFKMLNKI